MTVLQDLVTTEERRAHYAAIGAWDGSTQSAKVAGFAAQRGDAPAVIDLLGTRTTSWADLDRYSNQFAHHLASLGVTRGSVVAVQLPNWVEAIVANMAILRLGAVVSPMLPTYRELEISHMLSVAGTRVIITPDHHRNFEFGPMGQILLDTVDVLEHHIVVPNPADSPTFLHRFSSLPSTMPEVEIDPAAVSHLCFTSGTEAKPKALLHTEHTMCCENRMYGEVHQLHPGDVCWVPAPVGHSTGLKTWRLGLYHGLPVVLQDKWVPAEAARLIERFKCSFTQGATTFLTDLTTAAEETGADVSSLRAFICGGAVIPADAVARAAALGVRVFRVYGSTEHGMMSAVLPDDLIDKQHSTEGKPIYYVEFELFDAEDNVVSDGQPGEIIARSPACAVGLFNDDERMKQIYLEGGWIRSGDIGSIDSDGFLKIVGRVKQIIIRGGMNIAQKELEDALKNHPKLVGAIMIGVPDKRLGELVGACVVPVDGVTVELDDITTHLLDAGIAKYKLPQRLYVLDEFPLTPKGEISRPLLTRHVETVESQTVSAAT